LPSGFTIVGPSTGNSINVTIAAAFAAGNIGVTATNACGSTVGGLIQIIGKAPAIPVTLSGPVAVCGLTTATYSIPVVAYASGYTWTVPSWMTITGGFGTTTITVNVTGTPAAGTVSVAATNVCGTSPTRSVTLTLAATQPGSITGPASLCGLTSAVYSIAPVAAGYTYTWNLAMTGWHIGSITGPVTLTSSATSITVYGPATGTSTSGIVKVASNNTCGFTSTQRTLGVTYCHSAALDNNGNSTPDANPTNMFSAIYPNPTSGEFKIDITTDIDRDITLQVYDVLGNLVVNQKHLITAGTSTMNTNIETFRAGMYFVRLIDSNEGAVYSQTVLRQ
jgi:hypothetical protein